MEATQKQEAPAPQPKGITLAALGRIEVGVELLGTSGGEEGQNAVLVFEMERAGSKLFGAMKKRTAELKAKNASDGETATASVAMLVTDLRGLADFPPRGEDEPLAAFRARFTEYFEATGDAADTILGGALTAYNLTLIPRQVQSFRT